MAVKRKGTMKRTKATSGSEDKSHLGKALQAVRKQHELLNADMDRATDLIGQMRELQLELEEARKTLPENPNQIIQLVRRLRDGIKSLSREATLLYRGTQNTQTAVERHEEVAKGVDESKNSGK